VEAVRTEETETSPEDEEDMAALQAVFAKRRKSQIVSLSQMDSSQVTHTCIHTPWGFQRQFTNFVSAVPPRDVTPFRRAAD